LSLITFVLGASACKTDHYVTMISPVKLHGSHIPKKIRRQFSRVLKQRFCGNPAVWYADFLPDQGNLRYACPYRPAMINSSPQRWAVDFGRRFEDYWTNGVTCLYDPQKQLLGGEDPAFYEMPFTRGDAVQELMLYRDIWVYHAPVLRVDSFGVVRFFDSRYTDYIWSRFPNATVTYHGLVDMLVFHEGDQMVAWLAKLRLGVNERRRIEWLRNQQNAS